jgi:hypothetical protein
MHLDSYNCVSCQLNLEETVTLLFLECTFAKNCWNLFNIVFSATSTFPEALPQIRSQTKSVLHNFGYPPLLGYLDGKE